MKATLASVCFLIRDQQILLMQQEMGALAGSWSIVGGRMEAGETPEQTVRREVREETGLTLTSPRHAGHVLLCSADGEHVTALDLFVATACSGHLRGSEEGQPVWHALAEIGQVPLIGYIRLLLPFVQPPHAFVVGTIHLAPDGEPERYELRQFRSGECSC